MIPLLQKSMWLMRTPTRSQSLVELDSSGFVYDFCLPTYIHLFKQSCNFPQDKKEEPKNHITCERLMGKSHEIVYFTEAENSKKHENMSMHKLFLASKFCLKWFPSCRIIIKATMFIFGNNYLKSLDSTIFKASFIHPLITWCFDVGLRLNIENM